MNDWKPPSHLSRAYIERATNFQRVFAAYFPHLAEDFHQSCLEMEWLRSRVVLNPLKTVRRSQAKAELRKVAKALRVLIQLEMPYWLPLSCLLREAVEQAKKSDNKELQEIAEWEEEIFSFIMELSELRDDEKPHLATTPDKFVLDAETAIDCLPETANVNWEAVHAVDALRWLWWRNTDRLAPIRALNPASIFAAFLKEGFEYLDINADHLSAFKRWAARTPDSEKVL